MSLRKRNRHLARPEETPNMKRMEPDNPINLKTAKPPETLFQLVLYTLGRIGGRSSQMLIMGILICGAAAFVWSQIPEQGKLSIINHILHGSPSAAGIYPSVEIEESKLTYKFAEWTPVPPGGDATQACKVTTDEDLIVRRVRNEAIYLARRAGTSGKRSDFTSSTHHISYQESNYERIGGSHMAHYEVLLDISKEPVNLPFKAHLRSIRYGGFRDNNHEWASASVFQPTRAITIVIEFNSSKPGRNFQFGSSAEFDGGNNSPLYPTLVQSISTDPGRYNPTPGQYEITGNTLTWTLQYPMIGYCYRIDWDW